MVKIRLELDQAKLCLMQNLQGPSTSVSESASHADPDMVKVLIAKFSDEINRLKGENNQLKLQRDNVTQFYKDEFTRLWQ